MSVFEDFMIAQAMKDGMKPEIERLRKRVAVLERALLLRAKRESDTVFTPARRIEFWIKDAEESMKPVEAEEANHGA